MSKYANTCFKELLQFDTHHDIVTDRPLVGCYMCGTHVENICPDVTRAACMQTYRYTTIGAVDLLDHVVLQQRWPVSPPSTPSTSFDESLEVLDVPSSDMILLALFMLTMHLRWSPSL